MEMDFPHVRSSLICPLCGGSKEAGLICCWSCYRDRRMREGNQEVERLIAEADAKLLRDKCSPTHRAILSCCFVHHASIFVSCSRS